MPLFHWVMYKNLKTPLTFHINITSIATRWGGSPIKSIADQDCWAPYVGADFTQYKWRRCRTMIGEKPKRPDCILCVFKAYSASKKLLVHHIINCKYIIHCCENRVLETYSTSVSRTTVSGPSNQPKNNPCVSAWGNKFEIVFVRHITRPVSKWICIYQ